MALSQVNHPPDTFPNVIGTRPEDVQDLEADIDKEMSVYCDETVMYTLGDVSEGSSTSNEPLPGAMPIDKIAKKMFKGKPAYVHFFIEGSRVESNEELIQFLNTLMCQN